MDRSYVWPIALSASAHVALLFGFPSSPREPKMILKQKDTIVYPMPPPLEDPDPVPPEPTGGEAKETPEAPLLPRIEEPVPRPDVQTVFEIKVPKIESTVASDVKAVPLDFPRGRTGVGNGGEGIIPKDFLDNPPRARVQTAPFYPHEQRKAGVAGEVLVEFVVDETGRVLDPRVVNSTDRAFEETTLRAVSKWRFEPGRRDGRIVRFRMSVPVVFNLNE